MPRNSLKNRVDATLVVYVCCAGCVVTKDIPPYTVVAGIPAKKVGERPMNLKYEFEGKTCAFY